MTKTVKFVGVIYFPTQTFVLKEEPKRSVVWGETGSTIVACLQDVFLTICREKILSHHSAPWYLSSLAITLLPINHICSIAANQFSHMSKGLNSDIVNQ